MEPELHLVSFSEIQFQEESNPERAIKLTNAISKSGQLKDPPIVAKGIGKKFLQIDGTTRLSALKKLNCSHAVVQVVDYKDTGQVLIKSWVHVSKVSRKSFIEKIRKIKGIKTENFRLGLGLTLTGNPLAIASIIFRNGKGLSVIGNYSLINRVHLMRRVSKLYSKLVTRDHEVSIEGMAQLKNFFTRHKDKNVALFFPSFSSQEIFTLMKKGVTLPAGITKHVINGRVLRINYPIAMLKKGMSLVKKTRYFKKFLSGISFRFYEESTYMVE